MCGGVVLLPVLNVEEEVAGAALLKETHKRRADSLRLVGRHLGDLAVAVNKRAGNLLELEVASDIGVDENLGELARRQDELGDEVDGVVAVTAKREGLGGSSATELLVELQVSAYRWP